MVALLVTLLVVLAWAVLLVVSEFWHYQRGHDTWGWVKWIYKATGAHRIRW